MFESRFVLMESTVEHCSLLLQQKQKQNNLWVGSGRVGYLRFDNIYEGLVQQKLRLEPWTVHQYSCLCLKEGKNL